MSGNPNGIKNNSAPSPDVGVDGMQRAAVLPDEQEAEGRPEPNSPLAEGGMTGTGADAARNPRWLTAAETLLVTVWLLVLTRTTVIARLSLTLENTTATPTRSHA
jgi:hypothetical protein